MLTLKDGRTELWQWDTGREVAVSEACSQVHFSNKIQGRSIDVDAVDGVAKIPDVLLQTDGLLNVWAFVGTAENGYTKVSRIFVVNKRNRPADYVFTPTEQTSIKDLDERLKALEEVQDPEAVENAVKEYLEKNPIEENDPTVPQWAKQPEKPAYTAEEVGALPNTTKIPSKTSELTNDSGFLTQHQDLSAYAKKTDIPSVPTKTSQLTNDRGFLTEVPSEYVTETELQSKGYAKQTDVDNLSKDLSGYALKEEIPNTLPNPQKLTFTGAVEAEYDGSVPVTVEIPSGGSGGSSEFVELFRVTTIEAVLKIETGIDLSQYEEIVALCSTLSSDGTTNTHFVWNVTGYDAYITKGLHGTQKRVQFLHGKKVTDTKWKFEAWFAVANVTIFENDYAPGAIYADTVTTAMAIGNVIPQLIWVNGGLTPNFKFGAYTYGGTNLAIGTEAIVWGR